MFFIVYFHIMCMSILLACMCVPYVCGGQMSLLDFSELELQVVVNCHVCAGTRTESSERIVRTLLTAEPSE